MANGSGSAQIVKRADVLVATCAGAGHHDLADATFKCVVIDEATQAKEISTLIPLVKGAECVVLAGDPKQLPPTVMATGPEAAELQQCAFFYSCLVLSTRSCVLWLTAEHGSCANRRSVLTALLLLMPCLGDVDRKQWLPGHRATAPWLLDKHALFTCFVVLARHAAAMLSAVLVILLAGVAGPCRSATPVAGCYAQRSRASHLSLQASCIKVPAK